MDVSMADTSNTETIQTVKPLIPVCPLNFSQIERKSNEPLFENSFQFRMNSRVVSVHHHWEDLVKATAVAGSHGAGRRHCQTAVDVTEEIGPLDPISINVVHF